MSPVEAGAASLHASTCRFGRHREIRTPLGSGVSDVPSSHPRASRLVQRDEPLAGLGTGRLRAVSEVPRRQTAGSRHVPGRGAFDTAT